MLARLAHVVIRHRFIVIGVWLALTIFGAYAAGQVSKRWFQSFSIPGASAYETNQRTLKAYGVGVRPPNVVVFKTDGDATKSEAIRAATERVKKANPGALTSSYFSTGSDAFVSSDRHTTFMEVYPPGLATFDTKSGAKKTREGRVQRAAERDHGPRHRPRPARGGEPARRTAAARASCSRRWSADSARS